MAPDDSALLTLVGDVMPLLDIDEFRRGLLLALGAAVPSDWVSLNDVTPDAVVAISEPVAEPHWYRVFDEHGHENPLYQHFRDTPDGRAMRFSDVITREELEATTLFKEFYEPLGINHQIAFTLPNGSQGVLAVAMSRNDHDYSDDERDFLNRARPYLIQAYRNAYSYSRGTLEAPERLLGALLAEGLTPREAEVTQLVALGSSNRDVGAKLELSERTVQKHLENAFRKLEVTSRSEAATRAWELAGELGSDAEAG